MDDRGYFLDDREWKKQKEELTFQKKLIETLESKNEEMNKKIDKLQQRVRVYENSLDVWIAACAEKDAYLIQVLKKSDITTAKNVAFKKHMSLRNKALRKAVNELFDTASQKSMVPSEIFKMYKSIETIFSTDKNSKKMTEAKNFLVSRGLGKLEERAYKDLEKAEMVTGKALKLDIDKTDEMRSIDVRRRTNNRISELINEVSNQYSYSAKEIELPLTEYEINSLLIQQESQPKTLPQLQKVARSSENYLNGLENQMKDLENVITTEARKISTLKTLNAKKKERLMKELDTKTNISDEFQRLKETKNITMRLFRVKQDIKELHEVRMKDLDRKKEKLSDLKKQYHSVKKELNVVQKRLTVYESEQMNPAPVDPPEDDNLILMFTDIESSTSLWEHSTEAMTETLQIHNSVIRSILSRFSGYEVKTEGDSFMVAFSTVKEALKAAVEIQLQMINQPWPEEMVDHGNFTKIYDSRGQVLYNGPRVRIGIHKGTVIRKRDPTTQRIDFFGPTVNEAARVESSANGGQILLSSVAYEEVREEMEDLTPSMIVSEKGAYVMKGVAKPMKLFQVLPVEFSERNFDQKNRIRPDYEVLYRELSSTLESMNSLINTKFDDMDIQVERSEIQLEILVEKLAKLSEFMAVQSQLQDEPSSPKLQLQRQESLKQLKQMANSPKSGNESDDNSPHRIIRHQNSFRDMMKLQSNLYEQFKRSHSVRFSNLSLDDNRRKELEKRVKTITEEKEELEFTLKRLNDRLKGYLNQLESQQETIHSKDKTIHKLTMEINQLNQTIEAYKTSDKSEVSRRTNSPIEYLMGEQDKKEKTTRRRLLPRIEKVEKQILNTMKINHDLKMIRKSPSPKKVPKAKAAQLWGPKPLFEQETYYYRRLTPPRDVGREKNLFITPS